MSADSPRVGILMGSASDMDKMARAGDELRRFGVGFRIEVTSAHRSPARTLTLIGELEDQGVEVFIVGAGMAAHLAGVVHQHPAHGLGGGAEEVPAALPGHVPVAHQAQEGLVDQGRGLKGVAGPLAGHAPQGQGAQLVVDQLQQARPALAVVVVE